MFNNKLAVIYAAASMAAVLAISAVGAAAGTPAPGFTQTFTASSGAGEVLQFSVDAANMTYSYKVIQSSNRVPFGQTSTGVLSGKNAEGNYIVAASADSFIQAGKIFPIQNGLLAGHVQINLTSGAAMLSVFAASNPFRPLQAWLASAITQGLVVPTNPG